ALACAVAAGGADQNPDHGHGNAGVEKPPRHGTDEIPVRDVRCRRHALDDDDHDANGRPPASGNGTMRYFEDIQIGDRYSLGHHTFSAADIKTFARRFDPQLFHLDEAAAARSHFGALCASGWHTAVTWMRLIVDYRRRLDEEALA